MGGEGCRVGREDVGILGEKVVGGVGDKEGFWVDGLLVVGEVGKEDGRIVVGVAVTPIGIVVTPLTGPHASSP